MCKVLKTLCLLLVLLPIQAGEGAGDEELLERILLAQQGIERAQGLLHQQTVRADEPDRPGTLYHVRFWLEVPDRYHLRFQAADDDERVEWFLSDGVEEVRAERLFADDVPEVERAPVDREAWGLGRVADFLRLDRTVLERDFRPVARRLAEGDARAVPTAYAVLDLEVVDPGLREHLRSVRVELDERLRTAAIVVHDRNDNRITLTVIEIDDRAEIDPALFQWPE